ncbi:MAG: hypothetical protein ACK5TH_22625 [Prosthecobacter sp.]
MKTNITTFPEKVLASATRKRGASPPQDVSGLGWLLNEKLPPASQLPENPVLVLRKL